MEHVGQETFSCFVKGEVKKTKISVEKLVDYSRYHFDTERTGQETNDFSNFLLGSYNETFTWL